MGACRNPEAALAVLHALVLAREIDTFTCVAILAAALGEVASAGAELGGDGCVLLNPVCEGVLAVLDDTGYNFSSDLDSLAR